MIKHALVVLAASLAVNASAQVRVAPSASAVAWSGPLAAFTSELGAAGVSRLDSVSMPRLTAPDSEGRLPLVKNPELLNPLAETLADAFVDPEGFAEMPLEFKETILRNAAILTEERLGSAVWRVVLDTNKGIGRSQIDEVSRKTREARETSIYLNDRTLIGLEMMEKRVSDFAKARADAERAFLNDLPAKLAAGDFDGDTVMRAEADGDRVLWTTVDGDPARADATLEDALEARVAALGPLAPGPWKAADARLLLKSLNTAIESGVQGHSRRTVAMIERLDAFEKESGAAVAHPRLKRAAERFAAGSARAGDILVVKDFYRRANDSAADWRTRARVLATLSKGASGMPSWRTLEDTRRRLLADVERRVGSLAVFSLATILLALPGAALSFYAAVPGWVFALALAAVILQVPVLAYLWASGSRLEDDGRDALDDLMARNFSDRD